MTTEPDDKPQDWETLRSDAIAAVRREWLSSREFEAGETVDAVLAAVNLPWRLDERELQTRTKVAADLRRAAAGRREYARTAFKDADERDRVELAADAYDSAALIVEDPARLLGLIPSWQWTAEEQANVETWRQPTTDRPS